MAWVRDLLAHRPTWGSKLNLRIHCPAFRENRKITLGGEVKKIRVVLAAMPGMLRDIVRDAVVSQPDMRIVGDFGEGHRFLEALEGADVAIIGARQAEDSAVASRMLAASPRIRVVVVATNGRRAVLWEMRPYKVALHDVSPQALVTAVRGEVEGR